MFEQENNVNEQENKELMTLVNINKDAGEFYSSAREDAKNERLRSTFYDLELLHKDVARNIQSQILQNGGDAEAHETLTGKTAKFWASLSKMVSNDVDETLVSHLEEAEDRCLHSIRDAMESGKLRPSTKAFLQSELDALKKSHDYMKTLKETMKAA